MVSKKKVKPVLTKLVGGRFDGEVFLNHEQADEVLRIDPARIKWASIYRGKDGEKCEKGMRLLHFIEEITSDEAHRRSMEANPDRICGSEKKWLEFSYINVWKDR